MPTHSVEEHVASLTVKMLRARLKKEGRSTKGLKKQLADRLLATLQAKEPTNKSRGGGASGFSPGSSVRVATCHHDMPSGLRIGHLSRHRLRSACLTRLCAAPVLA